MRLDIFQRHSLKTRVTLFTLGIFVLSLWSLSLFASHELQTDMQQLLSQQQASAVTILTDEVNHELTRRQRLLEQAADGINPSLLGQAGALQAHLMAQQILQGQFNAAVMVLDAHGVAVAELPQGAGRTGLSFMDRDDVQIALQRGQAAFGSPVQSRVLKSAAIHMAVPIRNELGLVIGALVGITDLNQPSFLDMIANGRYGTSGGYLLVDPKTRRVITASNRSRILEQLPAPGVNAPLDRFLSGHEGTLLMRNPQGIDIMATDKGIAASGWVMAVVLPLEEAFAPIRAMQQRMLAATLLLTLLAVLLTRWMLHRELRPVMSTIKVLSERAMSKQNLQPLAIPPQHEIGQLIAGFNQLLTTIAEQQHALQNKQAMLTRSEAVSHIGSWQWDLGSCQMTWSDEMFRIFQMEPKDAAPSFVAQDGLFLPSETRRLHDAVTAAVTHHAPFELELSGLRPDGSTRIYMTRGQVELGIDQQVLRLYGSLQDVTEAKQAQLKMELAAKVFNHTHEGITITDASGDILDVNDTFTRITGYSHDEVLGQNPRLLKSGRQDLAFYQAMWLALTTAGHWCGEIWNRRKNGDIYPELINISAVRDSDGITRQYVALFSDITERKEREEQVRQLAFTDALTGLPNRRLLTDRMQQTLLTNKRNGHYAAAMYLDLDNFKPLNDRHGHAAGDLLLVEVANRLRACVREMDTVARIGGDEFVVMLSDLDADAQTSGELARAVAEKIRASVAAPYVLTLRQPGQADNTVVHHGSCTIGVTLFAPTSELDTILREADRAMYQAKGQGRNRVVFTQAN